MMRHCVKPFRLFTYIAIVSILLSGCSGKTPPTLAAGTPSFVVTPTTIVAAASETPSPTLNLKPQPGAPGIGDSLYPSLGNGGYDVQHYALDLTVNDVATSRLTGKTSIDAKATQSLSSFNLDFIGFEITSLSVNGQPAKYRRSQSELTITPSKPLLEDESFTVAVQYQGSPNDVRSAAIDINTGWITFPGGSFVLSEPEGAASFFPVNDHPLDKASYSLRVTVPKPYEAVANGILTETIDQQDATTFVFEAKEPMASYLLTIDVDEFDMETAQSENGIPIRNYYPTGLPKDLRKPFESQGDMLVYFSDIFGPYPFDTYGALVIDADFGAALENQTMSIFSKEMIDPNDLDGSQQVIAHELAHQWFGDNVSVADWRDIWLNESFATYAQGLWTEHIHGRAALDQWIKNVYAFVLKNRAKISPPGEPPADRLFNSGVYYWGALCLHALRLEVGDETFFNILKTYQERFQGGNARTADFIAVAEEVSGKDLKTFFDSWLYSEEVAPIPALGLGTK